VSNALLPAISIQRPKEEQDSCLDDDSDDAGSDASEVGGNLTNRTFSRSWYTLNLKVLCPVVLYRVMQGLRHDPHNDGYYIFIRRCLYRAVAPCSGILDRNLPFISDTVFERRRCS
jgi:hypothetical protein